MARFTSHAGARGGEAKDRAIRDKQEARLRPDLERFRKRIAMKSPLMERPVWRQLEHPVQTHIFLCVLARHLLVAIEKAFLHHGVHTSWGTPREQLTTHPVVTGALPATNGMTLRIRKGSTPDCAHQEVYKILGIPADAVRPAKTWRPSVVTESGLQ